MDYKCKNTYMTRQMAKDSGKSRWFRKESKGQKSREQGKKAGISMARRFTAVDRMEEEEGMLVV